MIVKKIDFIQVYFCEARNFFSDAMFTHGKSFQHTVCLFPCTLFASKIVTSASSMSANSNKFVTLHSVSDGLGRFATTCERIG